MEWPIGEAKAKFSAVIALAATEGAQTITKFGEPAAVILSPEDYQRLTSRSSFKDFLRSGNLPDVPLSRPNVSARDLPW